MSLQLRVGQTVYMHYVDDSRQQQPEWQPDKIHRQKKTSTETWLDDDCRGVARGGTGGSMPLQSSIEWIWLCWDVWRALFSKVTLFSLSEVKSVVFRGRQISKYLKYMDLAAGRAQVLRATTEKGRQLFLRKKCTLASSVVPPRQCKIWLRAWRRVQPVATMINRPIHHVKTKIWVSLLHSPSPPSSLQLQRRQHMTGPTGVRAWAYGRSAREQKLQLVLRDRVRVNHGLLSI